MRFGLLFFALILSISASAQTTSVLVAQSRYTPVGSYPMLTDSVRHRHFNGHNSTILADKDIRTYPDNGIYKADTSYYSKFYYYAFAYREVRAFNTAGLLTRYVKHQTSSSSPQPMNDETYIYNSLGLPDTINKWNSNTYDSTRSVYDYDNNGNLVYSIAYKYNYNPYDWWPTDRSTYTYSNGKVIQLYAEHIPWTSPVVWKPVYIDSFIATGVGSDSVYVRNLWNGTAYDETSRHLYKRDAGNRVLSDSVYQGGNFNEVTYYTYDAQGRLIADSNMFWNLVQQQIDTGVHRQYRYNAQSGITAIKTFDSSSSSIPIVFATIDSFTYNSYNQVTSRRSYDSTSGQLTPSVFPDIQYFYYELVVNNVPEVATTNPLHLYPVPATSYINISMSFTKPQPFNVRIFDMQGRLVNQWQEAAQKDYRKQVPVLNLAPGQYTLHILAREETVSRQFSVVR